MKQLEMHEYLVGVGEKVTVRLEGLPMDVSRSTELDGQPLPPLEEFQFTATSKEAPHKLLMYFQPFIHETVSFVVELTGSEGGGFSVPIELSDGRAQTRFFRFSVEGPAFRFGVPG
jgi:ribosomal protein S28E/S33